jgi:hypothetical protein
MAGVLTRHAAAVFQWARLFEKVQPKPRPQSMVSGDEAFVKCRKGLIQVNAQLIAVGERPSFNLNR